MKRWILPMIALAIGSASAMASDDGKKPWWGFDAGVYRPNSGEIRDRFGDVLYRFGLRPFEKRISDKWKFALDVTVIAARKRGNKLYAAPVTMGVTRSFGDPESRTIPFVQVGVGPAYYDYSIRRVVGSTVNRISTKRVGGNANIEFGLLMDKRFAIVGRADWYTKTDDFDFSGFSLTLSYAAFRW